MIACLDFNRSAIPLMTFINLQIECIHSALNALVFDAMYKTPREILKFIEAILSKLIPVTNYIMLDVKYHIISYFGRVPDLKWKGKIYMCVIFSTLFRQGIFYKQLLLYHTSYNLSET